MAWVNLNAFVANLEATGIWGTSAGKGPELLRAAFESKQQKHGSVIQTLWPLQSRFQLLSYDLCDTDSENEKL